MTFPEWVHSRSPDFWFWGPGSGASMERARALGNFRHVGLNAFKFKDEKFEFAPGDTMDTDDHQAWAYIIYTHWCKRKKQKPGPFVDLVKTLTAEDLKDFGPNGLDAFFK